MKLTDIDPYSGYGDPIYHAYMEYVGPNDKNAGGKSNKYWEVAVFANPAFKEPRGGQRYLVVRRWGKYGAKGQTKVEERWSEWSATDYARELKHKKREKGYTKEIDVITRLSTLVKEGDDE